MALSPYLNENPMDLAYALGQRSEILRRAFAEGDLVEVFVTLNGKPVLTTGLISVNSLVNHQSEARIPYRRRDRIRGYLNYLRFTKGFPFQATQRWSPRISKPLNGFVKVGINGQVVQSSRPFSLARSRSVGNSNIAYSSTPRSPKASSLRPSPEIWSNPFLSVREFGTPTSSTRILGILPTTRTFRLWSGNRTPGWGSLKRKQYVDNSHTVRLFEGHEDRYSWNQTQPASGNYDYRLKTFTDVYGALFPPYEHIDEAGFNALKKLIAKAGSGIQSNLAQNIAQVSQLSNLIFGTATAITSSIRQLKRGNIPGAISALGAGRVNPKWKGPKGKPSPTKTVAQNWLQLQYGWKPLLSDIEGFMQVMGTMNGPNDFVQRVRASSTATRQVVDNTYPPGDGLIGFGNTGKTTFVIQTTSKYVVRFRMDSPLQALFSQTGFTNPISLGWELLPFSFVVDWFLPIGSYFEALEAWKGMTFLGGSFTQFTKTRAASTISYSGPAVGEPTVNIDLYADFQWEEIRLGRTSLGDWPSPILPSFNKTGLSGGNRAANAIALLSQAFK